MDKPKGYLRKKKHQYYVFACSDNNSELDSHAYEGMTWAVSEKQAINNVRHNNYGDLTSQYHDNYIWSAILVD